jgi:hypothetical protein
VLACLAVFIKVILYEYRVWWGNLKEREHWENPGIDGRIILRGVFGKWDGGGVWIGLIWLRIGTGGRHLLMR